MSKLDANQVIKAVYDQTNNAIKVSSSGGGSGANTTLSNLTAPTAFNHDLLPGSNNTLKIGDGTHKILSLDVTSINNSGQTVIEVNAFTTLDNTGQTSIDFNSRNLDDSTGNLSVDWEQHLAFDTASIQSINYDARTLSGPVGPNTVAWGDQGISYDAGKVAVSIDLTANSPTTINTTIKFSSTVVDSEGGYSTGAGLFTIPVGKDGSYRVSATAATTSGLGSLYIGVNGTNVGRLCTLTSTNNIFSGSRIILVNPGDTVGIYVDATMTIAGTSPVSSNFSLERVRNA